MIGRARRGKPIGIQRLRRQIQQKGGPGESTSRWRMAAATRRSSAGSWLARWNPTAVRAERVSGGKAWKVEGETPPYGIRVVGRRRDQALRAFAPILVMASSYSDTTKTMDFH